MTQFLFDKVSISWIVAFVRLHKLNDINGNWIANFTSVFKLLSIESNLGSLVSAFLHKVDLPFFMLVFQYSTEHQIFFE